MTSQIKLKSCISLIYGLILLISYGCLPQKPCPPCPQHKTDTTTAAELADITKMLAYYDTLTKLSLQEINLEYSQIVESTRHDWVNQKKLIILSLLTPLSTDQLDRSRKLIGEINSETTFNSASSRKLLKLFLNIIQERQLLLAKIDQLSLSNTIQQTEISKIQDDLAQCETQTNTLQDQIKKLEEIEKIIIKRKETALPN